MSFLEPQSNIPEFSVSDISQALKQTVEQAYPYIRVRGEVSGFKRAASGHLYFTLKDDQAVLNAVCWRGVAGHLKTIPEDGLEVICTGKMTTYGGRSNYQLVVERVEMAGLGALMALLEKRKTALAAEGLFDPDAKKPLPFLPGCIGIVTSPTGAVIQDMLHRIEERFPSHVKLWPVLVQGEGAAEQIAAAVDGFNRMERVPDVLIVARGGGSLEDLWAFNEEIVVRAVAASRIPVISAVGHETDTTLVDYAADVRAPTPTAAAEFAVPVREELWYSVADFDRRLMVGLRRVVEQAQLRLESLGRSLPDIQSKFRECEQRLDDVAARYMAALNVCMERKQQALQLQVARFGVPDRLLDDASHRLQMQEAALQRLMPPILQNKQQQLTGLSKLLESYHYKNVLTRGFAVVHSGTKVVTKAKDVSATMQLQIEFADGSVDAVAKEG